MTDRKKTAALHNLGCKVNAYETEAMRQMLVDAGYEIVPFPDRADVYVINTCTVTNIADKKSRQMLHRARKANPDAIVAAVGCYAQMFPEKTEEDPAVDLVIGNNEKHRLLSLLDEFERGRVGGKIAECQNFESEHASPCLACVPDINVSDQPYEELSVLHPADHTRAFVKVQDGCNRFCSYCVIPYARGRARSRDPEQVLTEVRTLADNGYREIVLTGIHVSSYGMDNGASLTDLIHQMQETDGIRRIRLSSLEPGIITEQFVRELASMDKVCPHFHLSLQSGSDTVLSRMNRKYTAEEYLEKCALLRSRYEHPAITTDLIVGFPGETEEEFAETCDFVRRAAFAAIHVFPYSRREGTAAARMDGQVEESVKQERSRALLALAKEQKEQFENWYEGRRVEVLFEEPVLRGGVSYYTGFTPEYVKTAYRTEKSLRNEIMTVEFSRFIV